MKEIRPCQNPNGHNTKCDGIGNTRDHITPKSVGKLLGWSHKQLNRPDNIQYLNEYCHSDKDRDTPRRGELLKMQRSGVVFDFAKHREFMGLIEVI